jgi:hypothetical protein
MMASDDVVAINNQRLKEVRDSADRLAQRWDSVSNKLELVVDRLADISLNLHEIVESLPQEGEES